MLFRNKYRADNNKIKPDEGLVRYLSARMKAADSSGESDKKLSAEKQMSASRQSASGRTMAPPKKRIGFSRAAVAFAACFGLLFSVGGLYAYFDKSSPAPPVAKEAASQVKTGVTYAELYALIKSMEPQTDWTDAVGDFFAGFGGRKPSAEDNGNQEVATAATSVKSNAPAKGIGADAAQEYQRSDENADHSETNTQVEGVDEADIVKTDGRYIYTLTGSTLAIVRVQGAQMQVVSRTDCSEYDGEEKYAYPSEMYVKGDRLIVIKGIHTGDIAAKSRAIGEAVPEIAYYGGYDGGITSAAVYDIADRSAPKLLSDLGQSGSYLSSRMVGDTLYLLTNHTIYTPAKEKEPATYLPMLYARDEGAPMKAGDIAVSAQPQNRQYVVATSLDIVKPEERIASQSVFGCGTTLYANAENLLIASPASYQAEETEETKKTDMDTPEDDKDTEESGTVFESTTYTNVTNLIRFSLDKGKMALAASGTVPGSLLNQFSMDEYKGVFRVVTTADSYTETGSGSGDDAVVSWGMGGNTVNALYTLTDELEVLGKLENVAPGERVYSVRFAGDIGYFVTFRQVDPLFAVDLSDPAKPKILSALKIPGFSEYLHPYAQGLLFGFGKEADEKTGAVQGLKLSMFDVQNPADVSEKHKMVLSQHWSEASQNHKAIIVSPERGLIAFPADNQYLVFSYSKDTGFSREGAFRIDNENGYNLRGLYIGNTFYVCGPSAIAAYSMDGFAQLSKVSIR